MVEIKGLEKFAPKDFPGFISSTVFLGKCNFRCPYCHNADLVLRPETIPSIPLDYFACYLDSRKSWLEAVCVSGGEPLMEEYIEELLSVIKKRQFLVKIDSNGAFPERLKELIQKRLVDYVAMDIKAPLEKYREVTRSEVDHKAVADSVDIVKNSGLDYQFRTTVVPGLTGREDIAAISRWLSGAKAYQIQQFRPSQDLLDPGFRAVAPYNLQELREMAEIARPHFSDIKLEGIPDGS